MNKVLETTRLRLIACDPELLRAALSGNDALEQYLRISVPENWSEFGPGALQYVLDKLEQEPADEGWWTYFPVHKEDNCLIGSGGYKGRPVAGTVELGYEIAADYRNKGHATEMTQALVANALAHNDVAIVVAHTLGMENSSTRVLSKCGFQQVAAFEDPEDGLLWRWELARPR